MPVRFNPTGNLDIASDPADLPSQSDGKIEISGAMQRCTNLHLDRAGIACTRRGSQKLNTVAINTGITRLIEQAGVRYAFAGTQIYQDEISIETGLTDAPWSAILYNSYATTVQSVFALNGTNRKRITGSDVQEWGSESPTEAPTLAVGSFTGLTGAYNAKYTWARLEGTTVVWESNPSPAGNVVTLADQSLRVIAALPTDPQITHIRFYRTLTGGSVYYHDQDYAIPAQDATAYDYSYIFDWEEAYLSGTLYQCLTQDTVNNRVITYAWEVDPNAGITDSSINYKFTHEWENILLNLDNPRIDSTTADGSLGSECFWTNHDRPPLGATVIGPGFNGICFILKGNNLYYSIPNQPEYWPEAYYVEVGTVQYPLKAAAFLAGSLFVANAIEIYSIQGSGPASFMPLPMSAQTGTLNADCFVPVIGYGIFHLGNDGIYQYAAGKDQLISRGQFEPLFRGETRGNIPGLNRNYINRCWMAAYHGKLYFAYPGGTSEYPDNLLVMDLGTNRTVHHSYPATWRTVSIDNLNGRLLAGDTAGYVWSWEDVTLADDDGTAIAWEVQSKDFNQYYKYFPRYVKYDVKVISGTAAGYVIVDDVSKQTHTITGNRLTRKRLVEICTGDRLSARLSGSGSVEIYGVEIE